MYNIPFRHELIKKLVISFGAIFSHLKLQRQNSSGDIEQTIAVPVMYGSKERIFTRMRQDSELNNGVIQVLPIMSFEILGMRYDPERMTNKNHKIYCYGEDGSTTGMFTPVPYNIEIAAYILSKGAEDNFDLVEQILPLWAPEYTLIVDAVPEMNVKQNIPIILNGVDIDNDTESDFATRRFVTTTFNFTAKLNLYGPAVRNSIITRTETDLISKITVDERHISEGNLETMVITKDFWETP